MSGFVSKRFTGPAVLTGAAATKYTCPANRTARVRHIHVSNPTAGALTFTMSIGADAAGTRIFDVFSVAANSVYDHFGIYVLQAGELLQAFGGVALVLTIDGDEEVLS